MHKKIIATCAATCILTSCISGIAVAKSIDLSDELLETQKALDNSKAAVIEMEDEVVDLKAELKELKRDRWIYKGDFEITGYCNCPTCNGKWAYGPTKSGKMPVQGRTIAVDPDVIPLGTEVVIDNHVFIAEDTGSAIKGNKIDIYFDEHEDARAFGKQNKEVYI